MDCYREMYCRLFHKVTDIIEELQVIQMETEEMFLTQEPEPKILSISEIKEKN